MIKTVLLDLDNTLLNFFASEKKAISRVLNAQNLPCSEDILKRYSEINDSFWKRLETGEITREQVLSGRFETLFHELHAKNASVSAARETYEKALSESTDMIDGARELLDTLYKTYDLYIVSNGTAKIQDSRIEKTGIAPFFKDIFISQRIGCNKPSRLFFDACFAKIPQFSREQTVIVGDSLSSDIAGGIQSGIHTLWYNPQSEKAKDVVPEYEAGTLSDIPKILKRM